MSHWASSWPLRLNSTIVLSVLPLPLAWPWGPTPFWNATKMWPCRKVMSSGLLTIAPPALVILAPCANTLAVNCPLE
jgi:hypothetical protein